MRNPNYEILGEQIVREVLGASGFDTGTGIQFGLNTAAEAISRGIATKQANDDAAKVKENLNNAISADAQWAEAEAMLDLVKQSKDASRIGAAQAVASSAMLKAQQLGGSLPPDAQTERMNSAHEKAMKAAQDALAAPSDAAKQARMRAWQKIASSIGVGSLSSGGGGALVPYGHGHGGGGNFFTQSHAGIPTWGWIVGSAAVGTGLVLLIRSMRKKK